MNALRRFPFLCVIIGVSPLLGGPACGDDEGPAEPGPLTSTVSPRFQEVGEVISQRLTAPRNGRTATITVGSFRPAGSVLTPTNSPPAPPYASYDAVAASSSTFDSFFDETFMYRCGAVGRSAVFAEFAQENMQPNIDADTVGSSVECLSDEAFTARLLDGLRDLIDSISSISPEVFGPEIDIVSSRAREASSPDGFYDELLGCETATEEEVILCASPNAMEEDVVFLQMRLNAPVPLASGEQSYIYSFFFDSDGDEANNWLPQAPFDWDLFQGSDRWYQVIWDHVAQEWSVTVTQVSAGQTTTEVVSGARVHIGGDTITLIVPRSELRGAVLLYGTSAFSHDGLFGVETRAGDVDRANPTEPLTSI